MSEPITFAELIRSKINPEGLDLDAMPEDKRKGVTRNYNFSVDDLSVWWAKAEQSDEE